MKEDKITQENFFYNIRHLDLACNYTNPGYFTLAATDLKL